MVDYRLPQVLVPSSLFVSAQESRRAEGVQRVRSFHGEQLAGDARDGRYDRLRVVVSQPYNKHCQVRAHPLEGRSLVSPFPSLLIESARSTGCRSSTCSSRRRTRTGPAVRWRTRRRRPRGTPGGPARRPTTTSSAPASCSRSTATGKPPARRRAQVGAAHVARSPPRDRDDDAKRNCVFQIHKFDERQRWRGIASPIRPLN